MFKSPKFSSMSGFDDLGVFIFQYPQKEKKKNILQPVKAKRLEEKTVYN